MKTRIFILATLVLVLQAFAFTETRVITGTVTSAEDGSPLPGVNVILKGTTTGATTNVNGKYSIAVPVSGGTLVFSFIGLQSKEVKIGTRSVIDISLSLDTTQLSEVIVTGYASKRTKGESKAMGAHYQMAAPSQDMYQQPQWNTEEYDGITENIFHDAVRNPLSTFSIDVDAASYSNVRRFINNGQRPPKDAVRIEEMINYFDYDYSQPMNIRLTSLPKYQLHHGMLSISLCTLVYKERKYQQITYLHLTLSF